MKRSFEYLGAGLERMLGIRTVRAFWCRHANWGDALNPYLIHAISGSPVHFTDHPRLLKYMVVGSIVDAIDNNTVVWGAGSIHKGVRVKSRPKKVCAVRGPLTRELLISQGIDVPEVFGDPALLMPRFYDPDVEPRYEVGIVPHYADTEHPWAQRQRDDERVRIISVAEDTLSFVRSIKECRHIVSSSLHGIICADAYGIPATWVEFSNRVIGDGFKFHDYFASVNRTEYSRLRIDDHTTVSSVIDQHVPYEVSIDLDALYNACPFRPESE